MVDQEAVAEDQVPPHRMVDQVMPEGNDGGNGSYDGSAGHGGGAGGQGSDWKRWRLIGGAGVLGAGTYNLWEMLNRKTVSCIYWRRSWNTLTCPHNGYYAGGGGNSGGAGGMEVTCF